MGNLYKVQTEVKIGDKPGDYKVIKFFDVYVSDEYDIFGIFNIGKCRKDWPKERQWCIVHIPSATPVSFYRRKKDAEVFLVRLQEFCDLQDIFLMVHDPSIIWDELMDKFFLTYDKIIYGDKV